PGASSPPARPARPLRGTTCTMPETARPLSPAGKPARRARALASPPRRSRELRRALELDRAAVRLAHDLLDRRGDELVSEHHRPAAHEHVAHVARASRVND